jgi:phosphatidylglycerol:prolipoprotein diacylglycerol transferase
MHPILFKLPFVGLEIPTYGLFMAMGMLLGTWIFAWLASRSGADREACFEALLLTILVSLLSSKLVGMLLQPQPPRSLKEFADLFVHAGGVWYVGFLTGVAFATWRFARIGLKGMHGLDCAAAATAIGHGIGRLGCFFAGCCWGSACDLPWAITFTNPRAHALTGVPLGVPLHPTQLYEAGAEILLGLGLIAMIVRGKYRFAGQPGLTYLALYAIIRFSIELVRDDPRGAAAGFSTSQWIALTVFACVLPFYIMGLVRGTLAWWKPRR